MTYFSLNVIFTAHSPQDSGHEVTNSMSSTALIEEILKRKSHQSDTNNFRVQEGVIKFLLHVGCKAYTRDSPGHPCVRTGHLGRKANLGYKKAKSF